MPAEDWHLREQAVTVFLNGEAIPDRDLRGRAVTDDHFLLLFNGHHEPIPFTVPDGIDTTTWQVVVDTSGDDIDDDVPWETGSTHEMPGRAVVVLQATPQPELGG